MLMWRSWGIVRESTISTCKRKVFGIYSLVIMTYLTRRSYSRIAKERMCNVRKLGVGGVRLLARCTQLSPTYSCHSANTVGVGLFVLAGEGDGRVGCAGCGPRKISPISNRVLSTSSKPTPPPIYYF